MEPSGESTPSKASLQEDASFPPSENFNPSFAEGVAPITEDINAIPGSPVSPSARARRIPLELSSAAQEIHVPMPEEEESAGKGLLAHEGGVDPLKSRKSVDVPRVSLATGGPPPLPPKPLTRLELAKRHITFFVFFSCLVLMISLLIFNAVRPGANADPYLLTNQMTREGLMSHLHEFQRIANLHNGSRAVTLGYNASAAYVMEQLTAVGLQPYISPFTMAWYQELTTPRFSIVSPAPQTYTAEADFSTLSYSGSGDLVDLPLVQVEMWGCSYDDFVLPMVGSVALIMRGNCSFSEKADFAHQHGAVGIVVYNDGAASDRMGLIRGTLSGPAPGNIPVIGTTNSVGLSLKGLMNPRISMSVSTLMTTAYTYNVIADRVGTSGKVIVVGGHLDSVVAGPGINDNGSGSSLVLELAKAMMEVGRPLNTVRFAWWGAEEEGLVGSTAYVHSLSASQLREIAAAVNFDMVGSPNFFRGIYNGAGAASNIRAASVAIQQMLSRCFDKRNMTYLLADFNGRSDYGPFIENGIPAGGLETGAEVIKNAYERNIFGGLAGASFDPCYHQACDTVENVNIGVLTDLSKCAAYLVERLATQDLSVILPPVTAQRNGEASSRRRKSTVSVKDGVLYGAHFHQQVADDFEAFRQKLKKKEIMCAEPFTRKPAQPKALVELQEKLKTADVRRQPLVDPDLIAKLRAAVTNMSDYVEEQKRDLALGRSRSVSPSKLDRSTPKKNTIRKPLEQLTTKKYDAYIAASPADKLVVVSCFATWIRECRNAEQEMCQIKGELEQEYAKKKQTNPIDIVKFDMGESRFLNDRYGIRGLPMYLAYWQGKLVATSNSLWQMHRSAAKEQMFKWIEDGKRGRFLPSTYKVDFGTTSIDEGVTKRLEEHFAGMKMRGGRFL